MSALPFRVEGWQLLVGELAPAQLVDLRQPEAFARGHIEGAVNLPYDQLQERAFEVIDPTRTALLIDPGGARAAEMAIWLRERGVEAGYLAGGMARWQGEVVKG
ncbi:MAG: rhodanese-like domain-containing protein [Alphaproteobacteria bacterium]|nr:rhodanese-like domain-containing protein [Alphaproteobacteria bacterium]